MTVKKQLLLFFIAFALIPTAIISGISLLTNVKAIESIHLDRLGSITHTSAIACTQIVELKKDEVALLSTSWSVQDYLRMLDNSQVTEAERFSAQEGVKSRFHNYVDTLEAFDDLVLLDASGKVVVSYSEQAQNMDLAAADYFINVQDNPDPLYIFTSKVHLPLTENDNPDIRYLALSQALRNSEGELLAVLVAFIDTDFIADFTNTVNFGETGISAVIDADNFIICHPEHRFFLSYLTAPKLLNLLSLYQSGEINSRGIIEDVMDGIRRIYYYEVLPQIGMVLLMRQDYDEFSADRNAVYFNTLFAFVITTILAVLLGFRLAGRFVSPIQKLNRAFSDGQKEGAYRQCDLPANNEFGELAASYNEMIVTMEKHFTLLKEERDKNEYASLHDEITGLYNRSAFEREITHQTMQNIPFGIFYLDIDDFNQINYTFGHHIGDALLKAAAKRLLDSRANFDCLARISGDEFVLAKAGMPVEMMQAALALQDELKAPFSIAGSTFLITVSVGISCYPHDSLASHTLIANADIAMAQVKENGKNSFCLYDTRMRNHIDRHNRITDILRNCIDSSEAFFMFQPIFDITSEKVVGFETFIRIQNSKMGLLSPLEFIPVAENDSRLMYQLGLYILKSACQFAARLRTECDFDGFVSVNVSPIQLLDTNFIPDFFALMNQSGLSGHNIQLEIKDTMLLPGHQASLEKLKLLQEKGVLVALDNFDRQISSIEHLLAFPLNAIKFNTSFLPVATDDHLANINQAVMELIAGYGLKMIAVCVENAAEYEYLKAHKYTFMQGFHLCKPLLPEHACQKLRDNDWNI